MSVVFSKNDNRNNKSIKLNYLLENNKTFLLVC